MSDTKVPDVAPVPFTMVTGAPGAMVCEGDVCYIPGMDAETSDASRV
ncbi:hypothetical protein [Agromyces protaetiae]|nr:hypothetical protein [Agromyces protaetiae]